MDGLNKVQLIGRLGQDPTLQHGQKGTPYTHMSLACERSYMDNGERKTHVEWVPVTAFKKTAENCAAHLAKGSLVYIEGEVVTSKRQVEGKDVFSTKVRAGRVIFLNRKSAGDQAQRPAAGEDLGGQDDLGPAFPSDASGMDDVPF